MHLDVSEDQELYRDASLRFVESEYPLSSVRAALESEMELGRYLAQAGELGWFAAFVPESLGGGSVTGAAVLDASIVAVVRGRSLQPGPFAAPNAVAAVVAQWGSDELQAALLHDVAAGAASATWATTDATGSTDLGAGVAARATGDGYTLDGVKATVADGVGAGWLLVDAMGPDGPVVAVVAGSAPGLVVVARDGLDLTRRFADVRFEGVEVPGSAVLGTSDSAVAVHDRAMDIASALTVAESVGAMRVLFDMSVEYAKARTAFGRPIGSFQALKHLIADIALLVEASEAIADTAVRALDEGGPDASAAVSIAKAYVAESGIDVAQGCLQVHGGIGYTWEHDLHLFLRRLAADAALYGSAEWHRERLCRLEGL